MADYVYTRPTGADVRELLGQMRPLDRQEVEAASGDVERAVRGSVAVSDDPVAARGAEGLICIFGVVPTTRLSDTALIWMLGTPLVPRYAKAVLPEVKRFAHWCLERYDTIYNFVDVRNTPSIRLLERVGFQFDEPAPFGVARLPFRRFWMGQEHVFNATG